MNNKPLYELNISALVQKAWNINKSTENQVLVNRGHSEQINILLSNYK